jgi:hypothetical protein
MSDDITITGGSTRVASDALLVARETLASLAATLGDLAHALRPAFTPALAGGPVLIASPGSTQAQAAGRLAHEAATSLRSAASGSRRLADELGEAAANYRDADRDSDARMMDLSTVAGWAVGAMAPLVALAGALAVPQLFASLAAVLLVRAVVTGSPEQAVHDLGRMLGSRASMLRDPRVVSLIRFAVSGADDAMLGAAGMPFPVAALADDRRTGAFGLRGGAAFVVGMGRTVGLLRDAPVRVEHVSSGAVAPPTGFSDLARRIPPTRVDSPQVRIERYADAGGDPTYVVYVGGTVDTSPVAGREPFDITSDLVGVARLDPASLRATEQAMREAGIRPGDTVIPVGYSQGGIIATDIAVSSDYRTPALVTFGSPTAGVNVPSSTVDVAVEHTDDLVPALGGIPLAADRNGGDRIVVTRQTFEGEVPRGSSPIDAHLIQEYERTAQQMDAATDSRLSAALATLPSGPSGEAQLYQGFRTPARGGAGGGGSGGDWCGSWRTIRAPQRRSTGRKISPSSQLMIARISAAHTPDQKPATCSPNPMASLIHPTMRISRPLTIREMRPSVST